MKIRTNWLSLIFLDVLIGQVECSKVETQLFEDLMYNYNKVARPVRNSSDLLTITFGASLIRIIDIDEKNQVFTTNLWLRMQWTDSKLMWDPEQYGNLTKLHIPAEWIWTPDIVLYNNAAGDPEITIYNDALVHANGLVIWSPPAIYKSFCLVSFSISRLFDISSLCVCSRLVLFKNYLNESRRTASLPFYIDVTWWPYDSQHCEMKFGLWTYTGSYVDMRQSDDEKYGQSLEERARDDGTGTGMDLSYFYESAEWDLLELKSARHEKIYPGCCGPEKYVDITYSFRLRRKTLFFTVNLIIPCFLISFLTTFVFYLSDHKITFAISILVTLTVFFLVLIDIIPPTSTVIPMCAKYLLFTMILVTLSIVISVISANFHFRRGSTHTMSLWMRKVFLNVLPRLLWMKRPDANVLLDQQNARKSMENIEENRFVDDSLHRTCVPTARYLAELESSKLHTTEILSDPSVSGEWESSSSLMGNAGIRRRKETQGGSGSTSMDNFELQKRLHTRLIRQLLSHIQLIADHFCAIDDDEQEANDWRYVAMVIDRLFLILYGFFNIGTLFIILRAPTLYDRDLPLAIPEPSKPLGQDTVGFLFPKMINMRNFTSS